MASSDSKRPRSAPPSAPLPAEGSPAHLTQGDSKKSATDPAAAALPDRRVTRGLAAAAAPEANAGQNLNFKGPTPPDARVLSDAPREATSGDSSEKNSRGPSPAAAPPEASTRGRPAAPGFSTPGPRPRSRSRPVDPDKITLDYASSKITAIYLFGLENATRMAEIVGRHGSLDFRKLLEPKDASDQCKAVVGEFKDGIECYLCGIPISIGVTNSNDEMYRECEHIMPVVQGRWYGLIYIEGKDQDVDRLKIEYAWAHRCCNQAKSTELFISYPDSHAQVTIQDKVIDLALNKILSRAKKNGLQPIIGALDNPDKIRKRRDIIKEEKLQDILERINGRKPDIRNLDTLSHTAGLVDPNNLPNKLKKLGENMFLTSREVYEHNTDRNYRDMLNKEVDDELEELNEIDAAGTLMEFYNTVTKEEFEKADKMFEETFEEAQQSYEKEYRKPIDFKKFALEDARLKGLQLYASPGSTLNPGSQSSGGHARRRRKRRTRRRTDRLFPKLTKKTRRSHHSMRISSMRHSLSGKAAKR
jgi:hypothetical protein